MADTKRTREEKGTGKEDQRLEEAIEEELSREEAAETRRREHEEEEAERELGKDE